MAKKQITSGSQQVSMLSEQLGKLPPQAIEVEEVVLGALMLEKAAINVVADILNTDSFYKESHQLIYQAIIDLYTHSDPIDIKTTINQLRKNGHLDAVGGAYYVSHLTMNVNSSANLETHARILQEYQIKRTVIRISAELQHKAYEDTEDPHQILDYFSSEMGMATRKFYTRNFQKVNSLVGEVLSDIDAASKAVDGITGVPTGYTDFDKHTGGCQDGDLIIVAARPGMGKTGFVVGMAKNSASLGNPTGIFSLEMPDKQLVRRMISIDTQIELEMLKKGRLADYQWEQVLHKSGRISDLPVYIDDTPNITLLELRAKARRMVDEHGVRLIIIDYLQLMSGGKRYQNREQEIAEISRGLKGLAKELKVPVIALSQLSRDVEKRGDKRPMLSDLRESGSIEQDADMVVFLYRDEYYGVESDEHGMPTKGVAEAIISKYRDGRTGVIFMQFVGKFTEWKDKAIQMPKQEQSSMDFTITLPPQESKGDMPF